MPAQPQQINVSTANIWLSDIRTTSRTFINNTGVSMELTPCMVLGTVAASGDVCPCQSTNTDGSQNPRYLYYAPFPTQTQTVANGGTLTIAVAENGTINQNAVVFNLTTDTWSTVVNSGSETVAGTMYDLLLANSHFTLLPTTELTVYDNAL